MANSNTQAAFDIFSSLFKDLSLGKTTKLRTDTADNVKVKDGDTDVEFGVNDNSRQINSLPKVSDFKLKFDLGNRFPQNTIDSGSSIQFPPNFYTYEYSNVSTGTGAGQEIFPRSMVKSSAVDWKNIPEVKPGTQFVYNPSKFENFRDAALDITKPINPLYITGQSAKGGTLGGALGGALSFGALGALANAGYRWWRNRGLPPEYIDPEDTLSRSLLKGALAVGGAGALLGALLGSEQKREKSTWEA